MTSLKPLHVAALAVTVLLVATVVNFRMQPSSPDSARKDGKKKRIGPAQVAERCLIKRAVFGGTEAAVLKVKKDQMVHYVVLDLRGGDPMMPEYQSRWRKTNYGEAEPSLIGVYPTVEAGVRKAASLCRSN
jgi:hypothetical protein